ncbi:universal stress protein [Yinghuangia seranimata]|uniref:universal stress protein n=1 Tax=Yinghuangia seranimata TaxID=408067 RepID=UPI00248BB2E4|nr:universal stress protein [Yinghuangia seranimata]MDI2129534.1 universal stress protein [Yinghuangia seranimata]
MSGSLRFANSPSHAVQPAPDVHALELAGIAGEFPSPQAGPIVVGVDGSASDDVVVAWAAREAALRHCELLIVHAWQSDGVGRAPYAPPCDVGHDKVRADEARDVLVTAVNAALAVAPGIDVRTMAVAGRPAPTLLDAAKHASMLVLGRNRRTDAAQPTLGPVARACLRQASCPVTTITPGYAFRRSITPAAP